MLYMTHFSFQPLRPAQPPQSGDKGGTGAEQAGFEAVRGAAMQGISTSGKCAVYLYIDYSSTSRKIGLEAVRGAAMQGISTLGKRLSAQDGAILIEQ